MERTEQPHRQNPLLRLSYSLIAPLYDKLIERPMRTARERSLRSLQANETRRVLVSGAGTGLDFPWLPTQHRYTALDFNPAMLARAKARGEKLDVEFVLGDSMALPFADAQFDHVVLHLILAVVPQPQRCLSEAARVLRPGGTVLVFDKFLRRGEHAWVRRALTPLSRHFATRMDVVFEDVLRATHELELLSDTPMLAKGWFRAILLRKA